MNYGLQLDIDGREVPLDQVRPARLSEGQREILRHLRVNEQISSVEAGRILHLVRPQGCSFTGAKADNWRGGRGGCCPYGASDGSAALRRMAERGLVRKLEGGGFGSS